MAKRKKPFIKIDNFEYSESEIKKKIKKMIKDGLLIESIRDDGQIGLSVK